MTQLLDRVATGDDEALSRLWDLAHAEVRVMAAGLLRHEGAAGRGGEGDAGELRPTALVHEAFLRLHGAEAPTAFANRRHFFGAVATTLRRILVDHARARKRLKRGGGTARNVALEFVEGELTADAAARGFDAEAVEAAMDALDALAQEHPRAAEVARLRYLLGLGPVEVAGLLDISDRTVRSDWIFARAWLRDRMGD